MQFILCKKGKNVLVECEAMLKHAMRSLPFQEFQRKKDYLCQYVRRRPVEARSSYKGRKTASYDYIFEVNNLEIKVCKKFFKSTLAISNKAIDHALKNEDLQGSFSGKDGRGRHEPANKISEEDRQLIRDHIQSYPTVGPHYVRRDSTKQYLEASLDKGKMYNHYRQKSLANGKTPVSRPTFHRIFDTDFPNLAFHQPKKDQCATCTKFENMEPEEKEAFKPEYDAHIKRKEQAQAEKAKDKMEAASDQIQRRSITYDLQSVLYTPCSEVSTLYYKRKLAVYNFTVYDGATKPGNGYCFMWTEVDGNRGSIEIGSCLLEYLHSLPSTVKSVTMYSDTCGGQNRNQFIAGALLHSVKHTSLEVIEQKFLESGHTNMEVDSMHATIERAKKNKTVFIPEDWHGIVARARQKPYHIKKMEFHDFYDIKPLAENVRLGNRKDTDGNTVHWLRIKIMRYEKKLPNQIQFKYDYDEAEFHVIDLAGVGTRRSQQGSTSFRLPQAYNSLLPISLAKKKDLVDLCKSGAIPSCHHPFYNALPTSSMVEDRLPVPDVGEDSEGEEEY